MLTLRIWFRRLANHVSYRREQRRRQRQINREIENLLATKAHADAIRRRQELSAVVIGRFGGAK